MRKQNVFKRFLIVLAFVIFPFTGYFTVSHVTSCQAQCSGSCGSACIGGNSLSAALNGIYAGVIQPGIIQATQILELYFTPLSVDVGDGMIPVMDWSFRELSDWFDTFWYYNLLPPWQVMTSELGTANVEQVFALGSFADAANIIRNQGRMLGGGIVKDNTKAGDGYGGDLGIKDHREQRPSEQVCSVGTMMSGMERANGFSDAFNAWGAAGKLSISSDFFGSNSANGHAEYMCNRWQNNTTGCNTTGTGRYGYVSQWCDNNYNGGFAGCTPAQTTAAGPTGTNTLGKDVDVAGMIFAQDTIPLDPVQDPSPPGNMKRNLDELVTNLAEAFVKDPVTAGAAGKDGILQSLSYKAKRQVVYDGLYYIISRRVPGGLRSNPNYSQPPPAGGGMPPPPAGQPDYAALLKEIRGETGEDMTTGCGSGGPCTSPNPSRNEILRAMMTQRYQSGKYALRGIDEPENNQREQVIEQALQLIQMSDQLDLMDHYALLLASQVSSEIVNKTNFIQAAEGAPLQ